MAASGWGEAADAPSITIIPFHFITLLRHLGARYSWLGEERRHFSVQSLIQAEAGTESGTRTLLNQEGQTSGEREQPARPALAASLMPGTLRHCQLNYDQHRSTDSIQWCRINNIDWSGSQMVQLFHYQEMKSLIPGDA